MAQKVITKPEAVERGLKTYDGEPCEYGHSGKRFTKGNECVECNVERTRKFREKAKTGKPGKVTKSKAVAIIPRNELYDGGELPNWMARYGEGIRKDLVAIEDYYIAAAAKIAKVKGASTPRGFKKFLEEFGIGRTRAYELLGIADGRTTIAKVRESGRIRAKRFYEERKGRSLGTDSPAQPPTIESEAVEVTPPPPLVATEPAHSLEERDHLGRTWHEERAIENHLMRSIHEIYVEGFAGSSPEKLATMIEESDLDLIEKVAAFLTKLADAMRRKAEAA
jgi:hypothetical protein